MKFFKNSFATTTICFNVLWFVGGATDSLESDEINEEISITTSNRRKDYKSGEMIFSEDFDDLDLEIWNHELTFEGTTSNEFQMYDNDRTISYADRGLLYIKPALATDHYSPKSLFHGEISLEGTVPIDSCTNPRNLGCKRRGNYPKSIVNPVISARIRTVHSFYFQYGRVHIRAKIPSGDWIWPSISLLPRFNKYGPWPASGEIRLMESRGNEMLVDENGKEIGNKRITSALHFGPYFPFNGYEKAMKEKVHKKGFDEKFHLYSVEWTKDNITFFLDDVPTKVITPPEDGFWELGGFDKSVPNPWGNSDNKRMAPFDQKYFLALNVAVGGTSGHFSDTAFNGVAKKRKPWVNANSTGSFLTFYEARKEWYPTWAEDKAALIIDFIEIYAI